MRFFLLALPLVACAGRSEAPVATPPTYAPAGVDWSALHGVVPSAPLGPPTFTVTAHTGASRTEADLLGKPTVIWFYPAASTPG